MISAEDRLLGSGYLLYMVDLPNVPQTVSVPHFTKEPDISPVYAFRLCGLFAALGARGVSVLVASRDDGVGRGNCKDGEGNVHFYTHFPASCGCDF